MKSYKVSDLRRMIQESSQEFEPKLGAGVKSENEKNSKDFYKGTEKAAKDYDGGLQEPKKKKLEPKQDANKGLLDFNPVNEPDAKHKKNIIAQAEGYTSDLEKNNGIEHTGEFDGAKEIRKQFNDKRNEEEEKKKNLKTSGLKARELAKKDPKMFDVNHLDENKVTNFKPKRLIFKHTKFVNESQVLDRIPDEYKRHGQKIYMADGYGNEYIVECEQNKFNGFVETNIVSYKNEKVMSEQVSRIHELMNFNFEGGRRSVQQRINENRGNEGIFDATRNFCKK